MVLGMHYITAVTIQFDQMGVAATFNTNVNKHVVTQLNQDQTLSTEHLKGAFKPTKHRRFVDASKCAKLHRQCASYTFNNDGCSSIEQSSVAFTTGIRG